MNRLCTLLLFVMSTMGCIAQSDHYATKLMDFSKMRPIDSTDVVMIGSSRTEYAGDWNVLLKAKHIRNRGIAGDNIAGINKRLSSILMGKPRMVFLMLGADDIINGMSVEAAFLQSVNVINRIRKASPSTKLFVQSELPINESFQQLNGLEGKTDQIAQYNVRLRHYCQRHGISYINLFRDFVRHGTNQMRMELTQDGLHLTPFGYKLWAFNLRKYLVE